MRPEGMFRDETVLLVQGGRGGDGCCSFHREKYRPRGGPDGGDGGDGGSVLLVASPHERSLFALARRREVRAGHGAPGEGNNRHGRKGRDVILQVPVGTVVRDLERGNLLADLDRPGARLVLARGGRGGRGNARFATATDQAPRHRELGQPGEERRVLLELKLVADAGLVGLPNAGKSTLLRRLTAARPRVAAYPFTTLDPGLGIWRTGAEPAELVLADIPGLIAGAAQGRGLGHRFLRHVERTRVLLHLVDCSAGAEDPGAARAAVLQELAGYSPALAARPRVLVATKVEDAAAEEQARRLLAAAPEPGVAISALTGRGLEELRRVLLEVLQTASRPPGPEDGEEPAGGERPN